MKRILATLSISLLTLPCLHAQPLTRAELDKAVQYLNQTLEGVVKATDGLSEAQWNFKPAPDRWSVAEVTEHIAAAEDYLMTMIQEQVMTAPGRTNAEDVVTIDALVLTAIPDRTHKAQAPEPLRPDNRFGSPQKSLEHLKESRAKTIAFVKKTPGLRDHAVDSPLGKQLDGYEWILFIAAHSERHTKQINEVKADPNFPKS
jgi:hypothetical protein